MRATWRGETCTVLSTRTLFGRKVCTVWLPESGRVERVPERDLSPADAEPVPSFARIRALAAAGKVLDALGSHRRAFGEDVLLAPLDSAVTPLPHQLDALRRAAEMSPIRMLFADEVGLGKTIEAGLVMRELVLRGLARRILVVAPAGLAKQWVSEMKVHFDEDFHLLTPAQVEAAAGLVQAARAHLDLGPDAAENPYRLCDRAVCPLDAVKPLLRRRGWTQAQVNEWNDRRFRRLVEADWDLVVIDEAHRVAGADDRVARFLLGRGLGEAAPNLLLLSATPHQGKGDAFRRLLSILDAEAFPPGDPVSRERVSAILVRHDKRTAVDGFGRPLFHARRTRTLRIGWSAREQAQKELYEAVSGYVREGYGRLDRLTGRRRVMVGFLLALIQRLATSSTAAVARFLERRLEVLSGASAPDGAPEPAEDASLDAAPDGDDQEALEALARIHGAVEDEREEVTHLVELARRAEVSGPDAKTAKVLELLSSIAEEDRDPDAKLLVFTEFRATQEMLERVLRQHGIRTALIHGGLGMDERLASQRAFAGDGARVLISTEAGGEGLNLQFCHTVVNYDMPWNPMRLEQRMGRVDRIGQRRDVLAFNLMLADTVEAHVRDVLEEKLAVVLRDLGVDKLGDILDSAAVDPAFDAVYAAAARGGSDAAAEKAADVERAIRTAAREAKEFSDLYRPAPVSADEAGRYLRHPFPQWVKQMVLEDCRARGGTAEETLFGWTLREADGATVAENAVFDVEALGGSPSSLFLSVNRPEVRRVLDRLALAEAADGKIASVSVAGLPPGGGGTFLLCQVSAKAPGWERRRVVPRLFSDGAMRDASARQILERVFAGEFRPCGVAEFRLSGLEDDLERSLEPVFRELETQHERERREERDKKLGLFASRERACSRLGIENIRRSRLAQIAAERRKFEEAFAASESVVPDVRVMLALDIREEAGP